VTSKTLAKGNVLEDYMFKGARIKVYDGAIVSNNRDDSKVQEIINRIARIATESARTFSVKPATHTI